jgi:hypothetical protein
MSFVFVISGGRPGRGRHQVLGLDALGTFHSVELHAYPARRCIHPLHYLTIATIQIGGPGQSSGRYPVPWLAVFVFAEVVAEAGALHGFHLSFIFPVVHFFVTGTRYGGLRSADL